MRQAMRNPEFGVGHLEKWAEMLQILKDISANRMPNVADLLKQSAQSQVAASRPATPSKSAGNIQPSPGGPPQAEPNQKPPAPPLPRVVDVESTQQPPSDRENRGRGRRKRAASKKSGLPVTTIASAGPKKPGAAPPTPAGEKLEEAVKVQADLLAEFDRLADELNKVLANLEGSTLVKRLKAASRQQSVIAGKIGDQVGEAFGRSRRAARKARDVRRPDQARSQGKRRPFADHGRYASLFRAAAIPATSNWCSTKCASRTRSADCGNWVTICRLKPAFRSPSVNSGPTRSTAGPTIWSTSAKEASAPAASRRACCRRRSCWKRCKSSKAK